MKAANTSRWAPPQPAPKTESDIAVLWKDAESECVLSWLGDRYRIRITRGTSIVFDQLTLNEETALAIAREWRAESNGRDDA